MVNKHIKMYSTSLIISKFILKTYKAHIPFAGITRPDYWKYW